MQSDESKIEGGAQSRTCGPACSCDYCAQEMAKLIEKGAHDVKAAVSAKLGAGRMVVTNRLEETASGIRQHAFGYLALAFAAGAALGLLVPRFARK